MGMSAAIPQTMQAVLLLGHGGFEQLQFRDDVPVPRVGEGEVLVRIGAAAVNNTDINTRVGWYSVDTPADAHAASSWTGEKQHFPRIQGADGCGRVVAVGAGVAAKRIGERVLIDPIIRGAAGSRVQSAYLGSECDGTFAEYTRVPAANAHAIVSGYSDAELACFPCAYGAAEHMLERSGVKRDETVLVTGASGGVGSAAVQLASRRGAQVIAVAGLAKAGQVRALGAERVIQRDSGILEELGSESVDVVIDVVGGRQFGRLLEVLRRRGRYAVAGAISGAIVELDLRTLYLKDLDLQGCTLFEPPVFRSLIGYIERGEIRPLIASEHALGAIVAAQREFSAKAHVGKIVLTP